MKVGIIGAMPQEIALLQRDMQIARRQTHGMREYFEGQLYGRDAVLVYCRCAKVAAASTATTLIELFGVDLVVFTGVAGAADRALEIGDVVIATALVQHDLDARPLFPQFEVPFLGKRTFEVPGAILSLARRSAERYLNGPLHEDVPLEVLSAFGIKAAPRLWEGLIVSGDQFIANPDTLRGLQTALSNAGLPPPLCVEMEGAAAAQVCYEHGIPAVVMRTISDKADHSAGIDFFPFVDRIASHLTCGIVKELITLV